MTPEEKDAYLGVLVAIVALAAFTAIALAAR